MIEDHTIEDGNDTLSRQAPITTGKYLDAAVREIDAKFGDGFAKAHPELVGAFIQASAADFGASIVARAVEGICGAIADIGSDMADRSDNSGAIEQLAEATQNIAIVLDLAFVRTIPVKMIEEGDER